jgi:hypothetical protein
MTYRASKGEDCCPTEQERHINLEIYGTKVVKCLPDDSSKAMPLYRT